MKTSIIKKYEKNIFYFLGIITIIFIWFLVSKVIANEGIVPNISTVLNKLKIILLDKNTYVMIILTVLKILLALAISFALSVLLALLSLINQKIENFIRPSITLMRTVPVVSIAMIVLILFFRQNVRYLGTIIIAALVIIPILYEGILLGFKTIPNAVIDETKLVSNFNSNIFFHIYLPLAMPSIATSVVQSFGLGLKVLVMSEVIVNPNNSIGKVIGEEATYGNIDSVLAWTIILIVIVLIFDYFLKKIKIKSWD